MEPIAEGLLTSQYCDSGRWKLNLNNFTRTAAVMLLSAMFPLSLAAQQKPIPPTTPRMRGACSDRKKAAASIPKNVMDELLNAFDRHDFEEAVRIARSPRSGLKVASLHRDEKGRIATLWIVTRNNGCTVLMEGPKHVNRPF
jgi:hypothetical protein